MSKLHYSHPSVHYSNGYSLLEMVFVMLAITVFSIGLFVHSLSLFHRYALMQTTKRIEQSLLMAKHLSMMNHQRNSLELASDYYEFQGKRYEYYGNVNLVQPQIVSYNEHGRISSATTLVFQCHRYEQSIVLWLGQGVYETSEVRLLDD